MKKKIVTIIGTRPEIIKMFPLINQLDEHFNNILVWSGQHYDYSMVSNIFMDVGLRRPNFFIKINKKKNLFIEIQKKIFEIIKKTKPIGIIYHGDTFTTLASAIISRFFYQNITNVHIEGGYRSFDKAQTEEQVRFVSDHISKINFVSRKDDKINLNKENLNSNIVVVGNTINDSIKKIISKKKNIKLFMSLTKSVTPYGTPLPPTITHITNGLNSATISFTLKKAATFIALSIEVKMLMILKD